MITKLSFAQFYENKTLCHFRFNFQNFLLLVKLVTFKVIMHLSSVDSYMFIQNKLSALL